MVFTENSDRTFYNVKTVFIDNHCKIICRSIKIVSFSDELRKVKDVFVSQFSMEGIISTEKIIEFPTQVPNAILISAIVLLAVYWKFNR